MLALSELMGLPVVDSTGAVCGRVREVALYPHDDPAKIAGLIIRTRNGDRMVQGGSIASVADVVRTKSAAADWRELVSSEGFLLLDRDLLDQQIIDVNGRKVVRVNDVGLSLEHFNGSAVLSIAEVEIGTRGAVRRLLKGIVPRSALRSFAGKLPPRVIPWKAVDLIETDPARRVHLKIEHDRLEKLHPADLADILEDLAPAQREAVFEALDEEVAADALEEIDPRMQAALLNSLDSERAADIVEEMDPDAAANLLGELPEERSEEILGEMEQAEREEVQELLEFKEDTAAGHMTTDYIATAPTATVAHAIELLRGFEGGVESVNTIFLVDAAERFVGAVPLAHIALAEAATELISLSPEPLIYCTTHANEAEVTELFDKYNLLTLAVVDDEMKLVGVITADDVISLLRKKI